MKKIVYITMAFVLAFASCTNEEKDIFGDSAANRMAAALKEYKSILTSAPNGWIMEYYAGYDDDPIGKMGGYVFLMSFEEDLTVTIASEVYGQQPPKTKRESSFDLIADQGPVLTFNTYNEIFHIFSEPSQSDLDGYGGDYEFVVMSATPDKVILKGKRNENQVVMTPFPTSTTWDEYIDDVAALKNKLNFPIYNVTIDGAPTGLQVTLDPFQNYLEVISERFTWGDNCTYSPTGINLYKPVRIGEYNIESLVWEDTKKQFTTVVDGATIVLDGFYPEGYSFYDDYLGSYSVQYLNISNMLVSKRCSIIELDRSAGTFTVRGLFVEDCVVNYNVLSGGLSISAQSLSTPQSARDYVLLNLTGDEAGNMSVSNQYRYEGAFDEEGLITFQPNPFDTSFRGMAVLFIQEYEDGSLQYVFESENDVYMNLIMRKR